MSFALNPIDRWQQGKYVPFATEAYETTNVIRCLYVTTWVSFDWIKQRIQGEEPKSYLVNGHFRFKPADLVQMSLTTSANSLRKVIFSPITMGYLSYKLIDLIN